MDYLLERKIRVSADSEYENLYSWSLYEVDDKGVKIDGDWVPFAWSQSFTAKNIELHKRLSIEEETDDKDTDADADERKYVSTTKRVISGTLVSGFVRNGRDIEDQVRYSLFGTSRQVTEFHLTINEVEKGGKESCTLLAIPSYESEGKIMLTETEPDYIGFDVYLDQDRFNCLVSLIEKKAITNLSLLVSRVYGIYSHWTPTIATSTAKVLSKDCDIENVGDANNIKIPYVGKVSAFHVSFSSKTHLYQSQRDDDVDQDYGSPGILESLQNVRSSFDDAALGRELRSLMNEVKGVKVLLWLIVAALLLALLK